MQRGTRIGAEWVDLIADLLLTTDGVLPEERIATALHATFRTKGCAYHLRSGGFTQPVQRVWPRGTHDDRTLAVINSWAVDRAEHAHPVLRYYVATRRADVAQVGDIPSVFADRRVVDAWYETGREWQIPAQLAVPIHFGADASRSFVLGREDPFTPGEVDLARRIQRMLVGLDRHVATLDGHFLGTHGVEVASQVGLTTREVAVLGLVAQGLTAAAVARRLLIAEGTVRKHLEHVYSKLGVSDRLSAVLRARELALIPPRAH